MFFKGINWNIIEIVFIVPFLIACFFLMVGFAIIDLIWRFDKEDVEPAREFVWPDPHQR